MEPLHAPWRIEYILAPKPPLEQSIFTSAAQSSDDESNYVIARDRTCFALLNKYPYTGGHLMVVPYKQTPDLNGLTDEELGDLMKLLRRCQNWPDGVALSHRGCHRKSRVVPSVQQNRHGRPDQSFRLSATPAFAHRQP